MLIKIYDKTGILKAELSPENSSTQVKEIQGDNVLSLSFTLPRHIALDVDDYADFMWERYWLTKQYRPKQKSTGEWIYNLKMYGVESLIKNFLVIKSVDGDNEPVFTLTASPREHLVLIVKCINDGFGTNDWKVGKVEGVDNIVIDYRGKYCDEALRELAEKVGVEYWGEGTTVNLCRCEHGEPLTLGYDKGLTSLDCGDADNVKFYTRLFPVGSSKNIDQTKYGSSRLRLPGGQRYVEVNADKYSRVDHYEEAAFSGIYPHYTGTVSSVRSKELTGEDGNKFTVYYFKDNNLPFDPNQYEIGGLVKRVSFQEGSELAGLGSEDNGTYYFEVNFDSATREFEIITIWPYDDGTQLPGATLVPKPGDRYIPWNIRMPDEYYRRAEAELLDAVNKYNADHALDVAVYKAPTDHVWIEQNNIVLTVGRRVRLESEKYFPGPGYRDSRITKITRKVNLPSQMDLEISDALSRRTLDKVQDNITGIKNYVESGKAGLPDIIGTGDNTPFTDTNILSALRTIKEIAKRALSRLHDDEAVGLIKFLAGLEVGTYKEGLSGAKIDTDGNAIFGELLTRLKATLAQLQVNGASEFRGQLSSEDFISGFIGGKGWAIFKREVLNALGIPETKYTAEFDDIVIRGTLRVFTMVISQLLGENDNRIFTGMMEVDHYDPATGRVYLQTHDGKFYNPFRIDDYIMVQQYNGMPSAENDHYITKHYELIITDAGCGDQNDGEDRLDWVEFKNFVSADGRAAADAISKGDTFTRVDNATDADRKGLIQIITVGTATPYMDIVYGMKTDPDNYLKGRLGNLKGIHHHLFGWLDGFGELLTNLYAVGDFRLRRTGESIDVKIEMLKAMFATRYSNLRYELTEDDNYLRNATFDETMDGWTFQDDGKVITSNGEALLMNGNTYIADGRIAGIEQLDGRNVLHIKKSMIRQANALIRKPGTHKEYVPPTANDMTDQWVDVNDTLYMSIRFFAKSDGTLTIGMSGATSEPGSLPVPATVAVTSSMEWQDLQWQGTWDGKGDFILQYTGDMYVSVLSVTDKPLDDFKKEVSTQIIQTAGNIRLLGTNINNLRGTVTNLGIELDAAEEQIRIYADKYDKLNGTVTQLGIDLDAAEATLSLHANYIDNINDNITRLGVRLNAAEGSITNYATRISANETAISALRVKTDSISSTVAGVQGDLDTAKARIEAVAAIANSAGDAKVYNQASNPWNSWPSGQEHKYVGATWHNTSDGHTYRYIGYDNSNTWEDITNQQDSVSYILQNKDKISTVVGSFDSAGNLTNTSGLVTTAYASQIYATKTTVDALSGRVSTAEASINVHSTQIAMRVEKDGIISAINQSAESVTIQASKINFNGMVTMNNSFRVETNGTTHIGGFVVSGSGLTNGPDFSNDAYIIFRNDAHGCFAGIGGNVLPSTSGARGVARFENYDDSDWWGLGHNYALLVGARGAADNSAIAISGGYVSGLALKTQVIGHDSITQTTAPTTKSVTIARDVNSVYVSTHFNWRANSSKSYESKTREIRLTLPDMQPYDNGHVLFIKRGSNNGNYVRVIPGWSYRREYNSSTMKWETKSGRSYIIYDNESYATYSSPLTIESCGDAMCFIYHRELQVTISNVTYYGAWVQHKFPREW
ncbi:MULTISPECIES: hypothetical protein [Muribaculaceae]|jgi:hypothetical protein|uniref:hypothetical protein n=1 Tax=Muribaculaceae TaxID=2005473 RepID=UPI0025A54CB0|nr:MULTISPECIES: hypothetical protein [Muribaculaceae]